MSRLSQFCGPLLVPVQAIVSRRASPIIKKMQSHVFLQDSEDRGTLVPFPLTVLQEQLLYSTIRTQRCLCCRRGTCPRSAKHSSSCHYLSAVSCSWQMEKHFTCCRLRNQAVGCQLDYNCRVSRIQLLLLFNTALSFPTINISGKVKDRRPLKVKWFESYQLQ